MLRHIKSQFKLIYTLTVLVVTMLGGEVLGQTDSRPNIVFFFADDQRNDTLGCAGHPIVKTPTIDGLAKQGVLFENCLVSHSICWVSRTTILSGLTARSFGNDTVADKAKASAVETLYSDILRKAGYRTGYYGKWHAKMPQGYRPADHFDEFEKIGRNPFFKKMPDIFNSNLIFYFIFFALTISIMKLVNAHRFYILILECLGCIHLPNLT